MKRTNRIVPLGATGKFLMYWDEDLINDGWDDYEFEIDPDYCWDLLINPISYRGEIVWNEMSYRRFTEYSLTR